MAKILLINPPKLVPLLDWTMCYPPLGLMSVAANLGPHQVEILDMKSEKVKAGELRARIGSADIVGITVLTPSVDSALELCRVAKEMGTMTVLGGPHPSLMPQTVSRPEVDVVVRGEGEVTFRELADGMPLETVAGISFMEGDLIRHNPDRPPVVLATLPPPRRDLLGDNGARYHAFRQSMGALSTARGCPYRCSFCCVPALWKSYRQLPPEAVVDEIKRMRPTEIVSIVDDNFCHDMIRVEEICDLIIREGLNDRLYSVFSRVDSIVRYPGVVGKMAAANMRVVFIGIEAATQEALDRMNKRTRLEEIHQACDILERNGMIIWAGNIVGNLEDGYDDVEALIRMNLRLPIDIADFTVITPWPGTELFRVASERGLIDSYDFTEYCECEPHMHTPYLSGIEILELEMKAYMKFYGFFRLLGKAHRWSKNPQKRWLLDRDYKGFRAFWKFREKSAFYFWRTYRETVGRTEGVKVSRFNPLVSTPKLYSLSAGIIAAAVTLLVTVFNHRFYGDYASRAPGFRVADILSGAAFAAFVVAAVAVWLAVVSYRHGWIFSLRRRKPAGKRRSLFGKAMSYALAFGAIAFLAAAAAVTLIALTWSQARVDYAVKEVLVTAVAFVAALVPSYLAIRSARNGGVTKP